MFIFILPYIPESAYQFKSVTITVVMPFATTPLNDGNSVTFFNLPYSFRCWWHCQIPQIAFGTGSAMFGKVELHTMGSILATCFSFRFRGCYRCCWVGLRQRLLAHRYGCRWTLWPYFNLLNVSFYAVTVYGNEDSVGVAMRSNGLSRKELYITTKYDGGNIREEIEKSLKVHIDQRCLQCVDTARSLVPAMSTCIWFTFP